MKVMTPLVLLALALPAGADEVELNNGSVLTGVVLQQGEKVVLELDFGTMTFRKSEVRSVRKTSDPLKEYEQKLQAAGDAKGYYDVAIWAREKGLGNRANDIFRKVLSLNPDHEGARKALGFEKIDGKWFEGDELMMARGFLKHNGRWLPKDTVEKIQENDKQVLIETERRETAERIARLQREVELARIQIERERLERERLERERSDTDSWRWSWLNGTWSPWGVTRTVGTIPPPADARRQPAPFIIQGPAPCVMPVPARVRR